VAFVAPGIEDLLDRYPELEGVNLLRAQAVLAEATALVGDTWIDEFRVPAILALSAHIITAEAMAASMGSVSTLSGGLTSGPITTETVGPLSIQYRNTQPGNRGGGNNSIEMLDLESTIYGLRFLEYQGYSFPAAVAVI
jgi:hypothetical protein